MPACVLLVEVAFRGLLWLQGRPHDARVAQTSFETILARLRQPADMQEPEARADPAQEEFLSMWHPHPFTGFDSQRSLELMAKEARESLLPRDPKEYRILIVGGSVAWQFTPEGTGALREQLLADPRFAGRTIKFTNYARPGFKAPQMSMQVAFLFDLGLRFDAVIDIDGYNETALSSYNAAQGAHPAYPFIDQWAHVAHGRALDRASLDLLLDARAAQDRAIGIGEWALDHSFQWSSVLTTITRSRLAKAGSEFIAAQEKYVKHVAQEPENKVLLGPELEGGEEAVLAAIVRTWEESSRSLALMCRGRSVLYLHVLQPTLHDTGAKPLTAGEIEKGGAIDPTMIAGVRAGYPRLREAAHRLAAEGVPILDASRLFASVVEPVYIDQCHVNDFGNRLLALAIAEEFLRAAAAQEAQRDHPNPR